MPDEMTTYSDPDGGEVCGEFSFVTSDDWFNDDTDPLPLRRQRWVCVADEVGTYYPDTVTLCPVCEGEEEVAGETCEMCMGSGEHPMRGFGFVVEKVQ